MLLIETAMMKACKVGANITEIKEIRKQVVQLSNGATERRPVWGSVYLDGLPLGESAPEIKAPIALETGDMLLIRDNFPERELYEVWRDGKQVWGNKELHDREEQRIARMEEKLEARTKAGI